MTTGVVLARTGSTYRVHTDRGEVTATLRGRLKHQDGDRVVAGDVVDLDVPTGGEGGGGRATIVGVRRRRSVLARRAAGERSPRRQPIAANVDQVLVVAAARDPEPNPRMLDRFLVIAEANRLPCVVILNKIELDRSALERLARRYGVAGYQVLATSVKQPEGLTALRDLLRGRESVLAGPSGVGKSSLLNALYPGLNLRIGEISEKWGTGKHTTRAALLVPLPGGGAGGEGAGYVVDTPGLREVGTWGIDPELLGVCFPEFRRFLDQCRFDNCRHLPSRGARCARRPEPGPSTPTGSSPTGTSTRRSAFLPGPARGVARGDLVHHARERVVEVDPLRVRETDHDEEDVAELHRDGALGLSRLFRLLTEAVVQLARELTHLFGEPGEVRERREISFLILADPAIDRLLRLA